MSRVWIGESHLISTSINKSARGLAHYRTLRDARWPFTFLDPKFFSKKFH
jgi:hypothetical protein